MAIITQNITLRTNEMMKSVIPMREEEEKKQSGDDDSAAADAGAESGNDREDAGSSSGSEPPSSSSQGTSGGAGYSGDYSSISDSSETGGSRSKPQAVSDGRGGGKNVSDPVLKNKDSTYVPARARRQKRSNNNVDEGNNILHEEHRSNEHIHHHHHHRNHNGHHHHQAAGSNVSSLQDANSDEDINRKISEIMSLYKVSLQAQRNLKMNAEAAAMQAAKAASFDRPLQVENSELQNVLGSTAQSTSQNLTSSNQDELHDQSGHMDSSECYAHLVEACRPFFNDSRSLITGKIPPPIQATATDEAHSSSGFTSFFTTTNQSGSNSNTNGSGGSSNDSSNQKKVTSQAKDLEQDADPQLEQDNAANDTSSETSSLVVQARVKRKYKELSRRTSSSNSDQTNSQKMSNAGSTSLVGKNDEPLPSKRVRIETVALDVAKSKEKAKSKLQQRSESSSMTSSLSASTETNACHKDQGEEGGDTNECTTSSKPRVVTESSSGTTTANNSSGSGTGSGNDNNTTSKSDSGGDGYSDQQKLPADRDSTESEAGAGEYQNDEKVKPDNLVQPDAKTESPLIHHHHHVRNEKKAQEASMEVVADTSAAAAERKDEEDALVSKEKRLEKKRKRRESRREYEEELRQMRDSSENSSDAALEPGMPVTLEDCLSLTKTARLLVQALPPFLAVHINAAFTNLCGIQSSAIIGRPVATFISLPSNKEGESSGSDNANSREESDKLSSLSGSGSADDGQNGSSSALANRSRQAQGAAVAAGEANFHNPPSPQSGLGIDRLIVARGYGHIHNVELECHRLHNQHPHAIEGSEVKFIEGNNSPKCMKKTKPKLLCRMSVSPVISSFARAANGPQETQHVKGGTDSNSGNKRRKHKQTELQSVKHYLIQLEAVDGPRLLVSGTSFASCSTDTTLEAQLLGLTKAEVHARRCRLEARPEDNVRNQVVAQGNQQEQEHEDSIDDNSSSAMELVATCG